MMRARQVEHYEARRVRRARLQAAALCGLVLALGCGPDPEGKYNDFVNQTRESASASEGAETTSEPGTTGTPTTGGTSGGPALFDINGDFLLAVSTTVDRSKPLQFIATNTVTETDGKQVLSICLQPLTLMQGKVTIPREPIGEPLCFKDLDIVDNGFTLDAGIVSVTGMANPITGANIVASLIMAGKVKSDDLFCGTVTGEVMEPPVGSVEGSSFAAVRLADVKVLPDPVVIDCDGVSVTDP
ncbi:MAG: hypothetical protein H0T76_13700 [Nannocystis sp.]|nr:hypothetical protein [Nannocystis sp.]MBA3547533.1 hypothetical protein [Nannocystis sp.]